MVTRRVTAKDGEAAITMLARERRTTGYVTELRRCKGSARFGIEPHEAPISTFPKQPSRKDGLGAMCAEHWKAYVKRLTADRKARAASGGAGPEPQASERTTRATAKHTADAGEVAQVDARPAEPGVDRVGGAHAQARRRTMAEGATAETPLAESTDSGIDEADGG